MATENLVLDFLVRAEGVKESPERQRLLRSHLRALIRKSTAMSDLERYKLRYELRQLQKTDWEAQTMSLVATLLFLLDCQCKRVSGTFSTVVEEEESNNNSNSSSSQRKKKKKKKGRFRAAFKKLFRRRRSNKTPKPQNPKTPKPLIIEHS